MGGWPGSWRWDKEISEKINGMNGWIFGIHMSLLQRAASLAGGQVRGESDGGSE